MTQSTSCDSLIDARLHATYRPHPLCLVRGMQLRHSNLDQNAMGQPWHPRHHAQLFRYQPPQHGGATDKGTPIEEVVL